MSKTGRFKYFLGATLLLVVSISLLRSSFQVLKSKGRLDEINKEVLGLEKQKEQLEKEVEYKKTEEYIEEKARNELNLIKPGEKVFVVVGGDEVKGSSQSVLSGSSERKKSENKEKNWYSWYKLFF